MKPREALTQWPCLGLDDTAPRLACPVLRGLCLRKQGPFLSVQGPGFSQMTPLPDPAKVSWLWGPVEPQLSACKSAFHLSHPVPTHVMTHRELGTPLLPKKAQGYE